MLEILGLILEETIFFILNEEIHVINDTVEELSDLIKYGKIFISIFQYFFLKEINIVNEFIANDVVNLLFNKQNKRNILIKISKKNKLLKILRMNILHRY